MKLVAWTITSLMYLFVSPTFSTLDLFCSFFSFSTLDLFWIFFQYTVVVFLKPLSLLSLATVSHLESAWMANKWAQHHDVFLQIDKCLLIFYQNLFLPLEENGRVSDPFDSEATIPIHQYPHTPLKQQWRKCKFVAEC